MFDDRDRGGVSVESALLLVFVAVAAVASIAALGRAVINLSVVPEIGLPPDGPP